jgi:KaiC/GvpD/RAD55 family RecA-like ATPase
MIELGRDGRHFEPQKSESAMRLAILGPDGTGKSLLALHAASRYAADYWSQIAHHTGARPAVIYISSDLGFKSAKKVWQGNAGKDSDPPGFALHRPNTREIPFEPVRHAVSRSKNHKADNDEVEFIPLMPIADPISASTVSSGGPKSGSISVWDYLESLSQPSKNPVVGFVDLASDTTGDDWTFVNSLLLQLEGRSTELCRHLVIIDSVSGMEMLSGKLDAFGYEQSRRARITQCMRNAGEHTHLIFVCEEPIGQDRLPEEYVTDIVFRLRQHAKDGAAQRTIEIEKARARDHASGEHPFEIRGSGGSSTGQWENPDKPRTKNSYLHVFYSLALRNNLGARSTGSGEREADPDVAPFGVHYLDSLLYPSGVNSVRFGLPLGSTSAVIGDSSTGKSVLSEKFLAENLKILTRLFVGSYAYLVAGKESKEGKKEWEELLDKLAEGIVPTSGSAASQSAQQDSRVGGEVQEDLYECALRQQKNGIEATNKQIRKLHAPNPDAFLLDPRIQALETVRPDEGKTPVFSRIPILMDWARSTKPESKPLSGDEREVLRRLFQHPNLRWPGVLITTADKNSNLLAKRCISYLSEYLRSMMSEFKIEPSYRSRLLDILEDLFAQQLIVRRIDIDNADPAIAFHVIQRNVIAAQELIFGPAFPIHSEHRFYKSLRIRLVIDDLNVLFSICPQLAKDSIFMPYLPFFLEREGITSLLVYTDAVRPDRRPEDPVSRSLISLTRQALFLWMVPFEGRSKVAISAVPSSSAENNGLVRELVLVEPRDFKDEGMELGKDVKERRYELTSRPKIPVVTPRFELYSGIEEGHPRLVGLAVYLFEETPAFSAYIEQLNSTLKELFPPISGKKGFESGQIVLPLEADRYFAMRDYIHLPMDVQEGHTMVLEVDGFWSLSTDGALSSQSEYLQQQATLGGTELDRHQDPFRLFHGPPLSDSKGPIPGPRRIDYFRNKFYRSRLISFDFKNHREVPDRVPFMWDFGFLLSQSQAWRTAEDLPLEYFGPEDHKREFHGTSENGLNDKDKSCPLLVRDVRQNLSVNPKRDHPMLTDCPQEPPSKGAPAKSWRHFAGACSIVASDWHRQTGKPSRSFDLFSSSWETINCLFLEMFFSEYYEMCNATNRDELVAKLAETVYVPQGVKGDHPIDLVEKLCTSKESVSEIVRREILEYRKIVSPEGSSRDISEMDLPERLTLRKRAEAAEGNKENREHFDSIFRKLPIGFVALYKTWLLLQEMVDFKRARGDGAHSSVMPKRVASEPAVASRHWYKTACTYAEEVVKWDEGGLFPMRLPGHFSSRGDWFLASSRGSRSKLLAQHAIDLLSSRRANMERLELGLGLPVRDIICDEECGNLLTALRCQESIDGESKHLLYGEIAALRARSYKEDIPGVDSGFFWLWRSSIKDYDRQGRVLMKWLKRLFQWTASYQVKHQRGWEEGFKGYDYLQAKRLSCVVIYDSFVDMAELCDLLIHDLRAARRRGAEPDGSHASHPEGLEGST